MEVWEVMVDFARHDVFSKILAQQYPESYDPNVPENQWRGQKSLTEATNTPLDAGVGASPTRTYAPTQSNFSQRIDRFGDGALRGGLKPYSTLSMASCW